MIRGAFNRIEQDAVDAAIKAVGERYGLSLVRGVATAATLPNARQTIIIDPDTGYPVEPETEGLYYPGDLPGDEELSLS